MDYKQTLIIAHEIAVKYGVAEDVNWKPKLIWHLSSYGDDDMAFKNEDIETVVTKEMMESISYKVERKD